MAMNTPYVHSHNFIIIIYRIQMHKLVFYSEQRRYE